MAHLQLELESQEEAKQIERQNAEIKASIRSIKTNIALTITIFLALVLSIVLSEAGKIFLFTMLKGSAPILTFILNFGKIKSVFLLYWQNFKEIILKLKT